MNETILFIAIILLGINIGIVLIVGCIGNRRYENSFLPKGFSNELHNLYVRLKHELNYERASAFEQGKAEGINEGKRLKEEEIRAQEDSRGFENAEKSRV